MADTKPEPGRWVLLKMIHAAVERTEAEIAELKSHGLFVRDASGPDDHHDDAAPQPEAPGHPARTQTPPAGSPPPGGKPEAKE